MNRFLCALALVPVLCGPVVACPYTYRSSYVAPTYSYSPAIVTAFTPLIAVPVAAYSTTYVAPAVAAPVAAAPAPAAVDCTAQTKALTERIVALEARLSQQPSVEQKNSPGLPPPLSKGDVGAGLTVFTNRCAGCHDAAKLKPKQPAFRQDGKLVPLSPKNAMNCVVAVGKGTMPPSGAELTATEVANLIEFLQAQVQ